MGLTDIEVLDIFKSKDTQITIILATQLFDLIVFEVNLLRDRGNPGEVYVDWGRGGDKIQWFFWMC